MPHYYEKEDNTARSVVAAIDNDKVNPLHYRQHPSGIEAIKVLQHHNYNIGAAMKYLWRNGLKKGESSADDLRKAIRYLEFELQRIGE